MSIQQLRTTSVPINRATSGAEILAVLRLEGADCAVAALGKVLVEVLEAERRGEGRRGEEDGGAENHFALRFAWY